jgi:hypothetical protein
MPEFTSMGGQIGRSIHDAPDDGPAEAERIERIMASVSRQDLERALVILLSAIRTAEDEQGRLDRELRPLLSKRYANAIDEIGHQLIEQGIDRVVDLLGSGVVDILEGMA